jgi:hypothetical protein
METDCLRAADLGKQTPGSMSRSPALAEAGVELGENGSVTHQLKG